MKLFDKKVLMVSGALALALSANTASAASYMTCDIPMNSCTFGDTQPGPTAPNTKFLNFHTFTLAFAKTITAGIFSQYPVNPTDFTQNVNFINPQGVSLTGGSLGSPVNFTVDSLGNPEIRSLSSLVLAAGTYSIRVEGTAGANGQYNGFATFGSVPEPATWAFMILGFGLIGGGMRRAKATNAALRYA